MDFDPLSDRINDRRDRQIEYDRVEIEQLRAECNSLAAERDLLKKRCAAFDLRNQIDTKIIEHLRANLHKTERALDQELNAA